MSEAQKEVEEETIHQVVNYNLTDAAIGELKEELGGLIIKDGDKADYKLVKVGLRRVITLRTDVEKRRRELKSDALAWGRKVDTEAKRISALLFEIEGPLKLEKSRVDDEADRIKREAEEAETARVAAHRRSIDEIRGFVVTFAHSDPAEIAQAIDLLNAIDISYETLEEFEVEAKVVKSEVFDTLLILFDESEDRLALKAQEAADLEAFKIEQKKLADEQAEFKRKQDELAEQQEEKERERKILQDEINADNKRDREAQQKTIDDQQAVIDADIQRIADEKRVAEAKAEHDRLVAEQQVVEDRKAKERIEREKASAPDLEKLRCFADKIDALEYPEGLADYCTNLLNEARRHLDTASQNLRDTRSELRKETAINGQ